MRESIDLRTFDVGLVSNPDQQDIPLEAQTEGSYNLDVQTQGKLKGIPKPTSVSSYGLDGVIHGWIERNTGEWDLIYSTELATKVIYDFYGTQSHATLTGMSSIPATSIVSNNREVHLSCGSDTASKWIGYISHGQFGGSSPSGLQVLSADVTIPSTSHFINAGAHTASTEESAQFPKGNEYEYKFSFVYDGYQESPLGGTADTVQITSNVDYINAIVYLTGYSSLNKRITGVKIYRRERPFFDSGLWTAYQAYLDSISKLPKNIRARVKDKQAIEDRYESGELGSWGEFKLVKDIDLVDSTGWTISGTTIAYAFQDNNKPGSSYYSNTGIDDYSDLYDNNSYNINRELSVACNDALFVANVAHPQIPDEDGAHMIVRSKSSRFDMFDWANDKIYLPTVPTALASHRGKLYAWDANTMYIIDPNTLIMVEQVHGRGCSSQRSVVQTDYGLFWANKNGVYWSTLTDELIQPTKDNLSEPIKTQYQTATVYHTPIVVYNSPRSQLLVHLDDDIYAYSTVEKRWDYYHSYKLVSQETVCGAFIGKDGETYTVTDEDLYQDFSDTDRKTWIFYSKEFTFDDPSQDKKFYKIVVDSSGSTLLKYSLDGGTNWTIFTSGDLQDIERAKSIKLYISGLSSSTTVDSISIIYRRLRGKR